MSLLDHYWSLASNDPKERISAAEALLKGLQSNESEDDWNYALKRLVRGLASSRGSARLGFSMALAELLQLRSADITVKQYLALCDSSFELSAGMKGNEERGILFGRLFALKILAKSSLWEAAEADPSDLVAFIEMIVNLALRKAWLREPAFYALCELVQTLGSVEGYSAGVEFAFRYMHEKGLTLSCEGVALALSVSREQRAKYNADYGWAKGDPLDKSNLALLSRVLREMPVSSGDVSDSKPYVHFVWSYLLREFSEAGAIEEDAVVSEEPPKKKAKHNKKKAKKLPMVSLSDFWSSAVDRDFFGPETSSERKMWGFEIFLLWSQEPQLPDVTPLFSSNFIKVLSLQLAQKDKNLNKIAKKIVNAITQTIVPRRPSQLIPIISQFMSCSPNFDKLSKTKLVSQLLSSVKDEADVVTLVHMLLDNIRSSPIEDLVQKQWIFDNLVQLVRNIKFRASQSGTDSKNGAADNANQKHGPAQGLTAASTPMTWVNDIFEALIPLAYFVNTKQSDQISESDQDRVSKMAQDRVMSILSATLGNNAKSVTLDPQSSWPYVVFQLILNFQKEHPEYEPRVEFDDETLKAKTKAENTLYKIHKKRNSSRHVDSSQLQAFELLFAMVLLQVYGSVPDAVSMLDELQMCYYKINGKRQAYEEGEDLESDAEDEPSVVLTEILISLLSQHSVVLRKLSEDVWRTFSGQFSASSLLLLCDILSAQEGAQGQRSLFDIENESEESEEEEEIEEEMEEVDDEEDEADEEDAVNSNGNDASDSDADDDASSDYEMDEVTKKKLAGALGVESNIDGDNGEEEEGSGSDEDSMDDEQMSALDVHLATIFRERRKQQSKAKELRMENSRAKQNVLQLKGRILDLLDIYLSAQPENIVGLVCVEPLLKFIQETKETRLAERARELLKTRLCRKTNYKLSSEGEIMETLELMRKIHGIAAESQSKILGLACNQVSVFLAKLVISFDPELISAVSNIYNQSLQTWFTNSSNQTMPNLFIDFVNFLDTKRAAQQNPST